MRKIFYILLCVSLFTSFLMLNVRAQDKEVYDGLKTTLEEAEMKKQVKDKFDAEGEISLLVGKIIKIVLSFVGVIFLVLTIYGGFLWMTAGGNDEQVGKAKKIIIAAAVGLFIVLAAYILTFFVVGRIGESAGLATP